AVAVRRDLEEVERERYWSGAHEIGQEGERTLQDRHEYQIFALVIRSDLRTELAHFRGDLLCADQDLRHVVRLLGTCKDGHERPIVAGGVPRGRRAPSGRTTTAAARGRSRAHRGHRPRAR